MTSINTEGRARAQVGLPASGKVMCGHPSIRSQPIRSGTQTEAELFARVLREVFHEAAWDDVECCARRAWRHIGQITGQDWDEVRDSIRQAWRIQ